MIDLTNQCKVVTTISRPRTSYLKFSPLGTHLVTWETFYSKKNKIKFTYHYNQCNLNNKLNQVGKEDQKEVSNLNIYHTSTGELVKSQVQKKQADAFVDWSSDDSLFATLSGSEVLFFETKNPETIANRLRIENLASFSMHPISKCIAVHGTGKKVIYFMLTHLNIYFYL